MQRNTYFNFLNPPKHYSVTQHHMHAVRHHPRIVSACSKHQQAFLGCFERHVARWYDQIRSVGQITLVWFYTATALVLTAGE